MANEIYKISVNNTNYDVVDNRIITLQDNGTTTAGTWKAKTDKITALADGQMFYYKIVKAGASTTTLNITNSAGTALGAKTIYINGTTKLTTQYIVGEYLLLSYNSTNDCFRLVTNYSVSVDVSGKEDKSNKKSVISQSTDEYPNMKALYDYLPKVIR